MSGDYDENRYHRAMELLRVLCSNTCAAQEREKCQELTGHVGPINTGEVPRSRGNDVAHYLKDRSLQEGGPCSSSRSKHRS